MDAKKKQEVRQEFLHLVNLSPAELEKWLATDRSKAAGQHSSDGESTGHASGRRIVELLRQKEDQLSDDDYEHMQKVNGFIHRHLAQRPTGEIEDSRWRQSLMNWGHDPLT
ncbi:DUF3140 domain-containing protein [Streptomyces sp. NBC_00306]|uniref:DUF3140 domain-containing protein n=1 Tax=Streptomyces sp. NBC_00306 TaxID=2975708 RepID=UPI002E2E7C55|nr:DUF3140 domain-containing protein [Streptomyces sp. NBC_00306]